MLATPSFTNMTGSSRTASVLAGAEGTATDKGGEVPGLRGFMVQRGGQMIKRSKAQDTECQTVLSAPEKTTKQRRGKKCGRGTY